MIEKITYLDFDGRMHQAKWVAPALSPVARASGFAVIEILGGALDGQKLYAIEDRIGRRGQGMFWEAPAWEASEP